MLNRYLKEGYRILLYIDEVEKVKEQIIYLEDIIQKQEDQIYQIGQIKSLQSLEDYVVNSQIDIFDQILEYKTELGYNKNAQIRLESQLKYPFKYFSNFNDRQQLKIFLNLDYQENKQIKQQEVKKDQKVNQKEKKQKIEIEEENLFLKFKQSFLLELNQINNENQKFQNNYKQIPQQIEQMVFQENQNNQKKYQIELNKYIHLFQRLLKLPQLSVQLSKNNYNLQSIQKLSIKNQDQLNLLEKQSEEKLKQKLLTQQLKQQIKPLQQNFQPNITKQEISKNLITKQDTSKSPVKKPYQFSINEILNDDDEDYVKKKVKKESMDEIMYDPMIQIQIEPQKQNFQFNPSVLEVPSYQNDSKAILFDPEIDKSQPSFFKVDKNYEFDEPLKGSTIQIYQGKIKGKGINFQIKLYSCEEIRKLKKLQQIEKSLKLNGNTEIQSFQAFIKKIKRDRLVIFGWVDSQDQEIKNFSNSLHFQDKQIAGFKLSNGLTVNLLDIRTFLQFDSYQEYNLKIPKNFNPFLIFIIYQKMDSEIKEFIKPQVIQNWNQETVFHDIVNLSDTIYKKNQIQQVQIVEIQNIPNDLDQLSEITAEDNFSDKIDEKPNGLHEQKTHDPRQYLRNNQNQKQDQKNFYKK